MQRLGEQTLLFGRVYFKRRSCGPQQRRSVEPVFDKSAIQPNVKSGKATILPPSMHD